MSDPVLQIARGLVFVVERDGTAKIWVPNSKEVVSLEPDLVSLFLRFGEGRTASDAAEAAGVVIDDALAQVVAAFVRSGMLVEASARPSAPAVERVARGRIDELIDPGSFEPLADGPIVTGFAMIGGRRAAIAAWERGATAGIDAVVALQERVLAQPCPLVYILDRFSIGRSVDDLTGPTSVGTIYANQGRLVGIAPQIAIVAGALWRPAAFLPASCDLVIFVEPQGSVAIGDIGLVREMTGEVITEQALGGAQVHAETSGLADLVAPSTVEAAALARRYLALMPASGELPVQPGGSAPAVVPATLDSLVPDDSDRPFPIDVLVRAILDEGSALELRSAWARELSTTLGRLDGVPVGVIANCSQHKAGVLGVEASDKAARFVAQCDAHGLPLIFLVDVLGFAIGRAAERAGIERAAGRWFTALAKATVPKLTVVVRKAHTAGLFAMCGPAFEPDVFVALPAASIGMASERRAIEGVATLERTVDEPTREAIRAYLRARRRPPEDLAQAVVRPSELRALLASRLRPLLARKRR